MKKVLLVLALAVALGIVAFVIFKADISKEPHLGLVSTPTPTPTPVPPDTVATSEVRSPDGTMKLTMQKTQKGDGPTSYSFFVSSDDVGSLEIYSKTLTTGEMSIPLNSWAPDNKHLFIIENNGAGDNYLIFKASGDNFADGARFIDFMSHYSAKMTQYALKDVTGWDAPDLLHVRTDGPAYWFELGSNAFYRLVQR